MIRLRFPKFLRHWVQATLLAAVGLFAWSGAGLAQAPFVPQSGWWWNATEAGRGYSIEITTFSNPARAYFGAFMYDEEGSPVWYAAMLTAAEDGRTFAGQLMYFRRGLTSTSASAAPAGIVSGTIRVTFASETEAVIALGAADGSVPVVSIPISCFPIVGGGLLQAPPAESTLPQVGWWWNPDEPGRGMFFEVQSDADNGPTLFSVIYGYEGDGTPSWTVGVAPLVPAAAGWVAPSMMLHRCAGGQVLSRTGPKPATCAPVAGGNTTVQFDADRVHAVITLADGSRIPVQRFEF